MEIAPFQLISLEEDYSFKLDFNFNNTPASLNVGGKIDRVDRLGDTLRIIDYKTGNVSSKSFYAYDELFEKDKKDPKKEILQALIYCLAYKKATGYSGTIKPGIYSLREFFKKDTFDPYIKFNREILSFGETEDEFEEKLKILIEEIFSVPGQFYQTPHKSVCKYCPYNKICQRYAF
jgi:ATP-dependent helicase/DNAse subunit B